MSRAAWIAVIVMTLAASLTAADELEDRALAYEAWFHEYNQTPYGGSGYVHFAAPDSREIVGYSLSDSTIWTGTYLAAESFRYAVTGDPEAKDYAIQAVHALDAHLKITQVTGFIARFAGPDVYPVNAGYHGSDRYVAGTGEWEGSFWVNNTSRDQYTGWFFGMATAYDLVDDEPTRELIRDDVRMVIEKLHWDGWTILGENNLPTDAGPGALPQFRLPWSLIAAHILPDESVFRERYEELWGRDADNLDANSFSWLNKYQDYFGFNLSHTNYFSWLRLETDPVRRAYILRIFHDQIRGLVEGTHNVYFDDIYLANCARARECRSYNDTLTDLRAQIAEFPDAPEADVQLDIPEWPLDPLSVLLSDLIDKLGIRGLIDFEPQTLDPRPVSQRCPESFIWQKNPYIIECHGGDGREVYPGIDYMIAYWMGRYYSLIPPGNENPVYWPENDQPSGDDAAWDDDQTPPGDDAAADDDFGGQAPPADHGGKGCGID